MESKNNKTEVSINGRKEYLSVNSTVEDIINKFNLNKKNIVIEHNGNILEKEKTAGVLLHENDTVEIISFVGGG